MLRTTAVMFHDLKYAIRVMFKARAVTLVALATLALGIGVNTAIFSVVNGVLLRPLPYANADRLVMVWQDLRARGGPATEWTGPSQQVDWKSNTAVFENLASVRGWSASLAGGDMPEALQGEQTTYEYFDVLGVHPSLGRAFRDADDVPGAPRVVILSHGLWTRRFGADPQVIGRTLPINGESHEVIGVMPTGFRPTLVTGAALWRPQRMNRVTPSRNAAINHTIGRLRDGITLKQARANLGMFARDLERAHPDADANGINPVPLQEQQTTAVRTPLLVLQCAVGFVLLIACVNIANLLLSRASGRAREIAVRRALGAGRRRIVRQLLTESVVLAVSGGGLGVLLGLWGVPALTRLAPPGTPRIDEVTVDGQVLAFAALLSLATGVLFGLVPAAHAARDRVTGALKQGGRGQLGDGGRRARRALIVAELALALVLLAGGGLLMRTFVAMQRADLGFNPDRVLTGFILPAGANYRSEPARVAFYDAVLAKTAALPGVKFAALSSVIPLNGDSDTNFTIEGRPEPTRSGDALVTWYRVVSADYFATMQIPLTRGRLFTQREAAPAVVINETMARRYWPGDDPLGRRIRIGRVPATIVGVVADVRVRGPREPARVETYIPYWINPEAGVNVVVKTAGDPHALAEPMRRAIKEVDPAIAVAGMATMDEAVADSIGAPRFVATLVAIFGGLALVLAAVGVYGVLSYGVAQRTQEIGVRLALGAAERQIFALVVGESLRLAAVGSGIGLVLALGTGRAIRGLLFGVGGADALTLAVTAAVLVAVAFLAAYVPARRAMRVDPISALRAE